MADTKVLELEQERVDAAYAIAEQLRQDRDGPTPTATHKDAQAIHKGRQAKLDQLRQLLADGDRLLVDAHIVR